MPETRKRLSDYDQHQILQKSINNEDGTLAVGGFVATRIGHKILCNQISATVEQYEYYDGDVLLYTLEIEYNNANHDLLVRAERIA